MERKIPPFIRGQNDLDAQLSQRSGQFQILRAIHMLHNNVKTNLLKVK